MQEKFIQNVKKNTLFSPGDRIVVGVSGGADSVCLLQLLLEYKEPWQLTLYVVHVNHGIRGEEARRDGAFVEQLAKRCDLPFFLVEKDIPSIARAKNLTEEEAGRLVRYEELERIRREQKAQWIAVGHHQDDQAETLLFQLFRGAGARGLSAMSPKRDVIIRPLLPMSRKEIEAYLQQKGLSYCHDSTNDDVQYSRNRLRRDIMPQIRRDINEKAVVHIADAAEDIRVWRAYIEQQGALAAERLLTTNGREIEVDKEPFLAEHEAMQYEVLQQVFQMLPGGRKDIGRVHYRQARQMFLAESGKRVNLPRGIIAECRNKYVCFYVEDEKAATDFCVECEIPSVNIVEIEGEKRRISFTVKKRSDLPQEIPQKDYTKWFDYDKIKGSLFLRMPRERDFFILDENGHHKKLNKYYRDKKIVGRERTSQLVLAEESKILWAIPERISADCKITDETKKVLVVRITDIDL